MDDTAHQSFLRKYPVKSYSRGEIVIYQGEVPTSAFVVKSGLVKTYNLTMGGEENVVSFDIASDMLPSSWIFKRSPSALFFYEAVTDTELYAIPRQDILQKIDSDPSFKDSLFNRYLTSYIAQSLHLNALEHSKAGEKIIHTLYYLSLRYGKDGKNGLVELQIPLTQQDFASLLGLTRETTGIELNKLKKNGVISFRKKFYAINKQKLAHEMGSSDFDGLSI